MKFLILILGFIAAVNAGSEEWIAFKNQYGKSYESEEEDKRRMVIFEKNRKIIADHNQRYDLEQVQFTLHLNFYSDLLPEEFLPRHGRFNDTRGRRPFSQRQQHSIRGARARNVSVVDLEVFLPRHGRLNDARKREMVQHLQHLMQDALPWTDPGQHFTPFSKNWVDEGAVTDVKDQAQCNSAWAFSAAGALEGLHFVTSSDLVSISAQNLIDCSSQFGNHGCSGGTPNHAFQYVKANNGIDTEASYPYDANIHPCRYTNSSSVLPSLLGFVNVPSGDENALKKAVATKGPVSVIVDASRNTFQHYSSGVYYEPECDSVTVNHPMLVVGYGTTDQGLDYWLVKNSFGITWGEKGYIRMARNSGNNCGIATRASYPQI